MEVFNFRHFSCCKTKKWWKFRKIKKRKNMVKANLGNQDGYSTSRMKKHFVKKRERLMRILNQ